MPKSDEPTEVAPADAVTTAAQPPLLSSTLTSSTPSKPSSSYRSLRDVMLDSPYETNADANFMGNTDDEVIGSIATSGYEDLATRLLFCTTLVAANTKYRIREIEFYAHNDPYTHGGEEQVSSCGGWYFHRTKPIGGNFKGGTYMGLDISFAPVGLAGGILIRGLSKINGDIIEEEEESYIDGSCNCVRELLKACNVSAIQQLVDQPTFDWDALSTDGLLRLEEHSLPQSPLTTHNAKMEWKATSRVGLTAPSKKPQQFEARSKFQLQPLRFLSFPYQTKKEKTNITNAPLSGTFTIEKYEQFRNMKNSNGKTVKYGDGNEDDDDDDDDEEWPPSPPKKKQKTSPTINDGDDDDDEEEDDKKQESNKKSKELKEDNNINDDDCGEESSPPATNNNDYLLTTSALVEKKIPEDLLNLIKRAVELRKKSISNDQNWSRLIEIEGRIKKLANHYRSNGEIPSNWNYEVVTAELCGGDDDNNYSDYNDDDDDNDKSTSNKKVAAVATTTAIATTKATTSPPTTTTTTTNKSLKDMLHYAKTSKDYKILAMKLLFNTVIQVGGGQELSHYYRLRDIEFFGHDDPYTQKGDEQVTTYGSWYFHRVKPGAKWKGGTFMGLDISFAPVGLAGGICIRGMSRVPSSSSSSSPTGEDNDNNNEDHTSYKYFDGPCNCVRELLRACGETKIQDLVTRPEFHLDAFADDGIMKLVDLPNPSPPPLSTVTTPTTTPPLLEWKATTRAGLSPPEKKPEEQVERAKFCYLPQRFVSIPVETKKEKTKVTKSDIGGVYTGGPDDDGEGENTFGETIAEIQQEGAPESTAKATTYELFGTDSDDDDKEPALTPPAKKPKIHISLKKVGQGTASTATYTNTGTVAVWHYWLEKGMDGKQRGWHSYCATANGKLEGFLQNKGEMLAPARTTWHLKSGHFDYEVDVNNMTQRNIITGKVRPIRRVLPGQTCSMALQRHKKKKKKKLSSPPPSGMPPNKKSKLDKDDESDSDFDWDCGYDTDALIAESKSNSCAKPINGLQEFPDDTPAKKKAAAVPAKPMSKREKLEALQRKKRQESGAGSQSVSAPVGDGNCDLKLEPLFAGQTGYAWESLLTQVLESQPDAAKFIGPNRNKSILPVREMTFRSLMALPPEENNLVVFGQAPYPRVESASGIAMFDTLIGSWDCAQFGKTVSMRQIAKTAAVAKGIVNDDCKIADLRKAFEDHNIISPPEWFQAMLAQGVLMLNASLTVGGEISTAKHTNFWKPVMKCIVKEILKSKLDKFPAGSPKRRIGFLWWGNEALKTKKFLGPLLAEYENDLHITHIEHFNPAAQGDKFCQPPNHFVAVNKALVEGKLDPIDWLPNKAWLAENHVDDHASFITETQKLQALYLDRLQAGLDPTELSPITGIMNVELLQLPEACDGLGLRSSAASALTTVQNLDADELDDDELFLSDDEKGAVYLYTTNVLYRRLNEALRNPNRKKVMAYYQYLRHFLDAHAKLNSKPYALYRGINKDLTSHYKTGETVTWWTVSSCTSNKSVAEGFGGAFSTGTLFHVKTKTAVSIMKLSAYKSEDEYVLAPGTRLRVVKVVKAPNQAGHIYLEEIMGQRWVI